MSNQVPSTDRQLPTRPKTRELFAAIAELKRWTITECTAAAAEALIKSDPDLKRRLGSKLSALT